MRALLYFQDLRSRTQFRLLLRDLGLEVVALSPDDCSEWSGMQVDFVVADLAPAALTPAMRWIGRLRGTGDRAPLVLAYRPQAPAAVRTAYRALGCAGTLAAPFDEARLRPVLAKLIALRRPAKSSSDVMAAYPG